MDDGNKMLLEIKVPMGEIGKQIQANLEHMGGRLFIVSDGPNQYKKTLDRIVKEWKPT
jgi:hypothetical protein